MNIIEISYRALRTGSGYNNAAVEARAAVDEGETPEAALAQLRFWVDKQLDDTLKLDDAYATLSEIRAREAASKKEAERYEAKTREAREFVATCRELIDLAREHGKGGIALSLQHML